MATPMWAVVTVLFHLCLFGSGGVEASALPSGSSMPKGSVLGDHVCIHDKVNDATIPNYKLILYTWLMYRYIAVANLNSSVYGC